MREIDGLVRPVVASQAGLVARRQLKPLGVSWDAVRANIAAHRWVERSPRVLSTTTGELTRQQRWWLAVLHAGPHSMLGALTAAESHGLAGWTREVVTVVVDDELSFEHVDGVHFFRSRRRLELLRSTRPGIPRMALEPALLLWAGYDAPPRAAHAVVAAAVQQRLTTPQRFSEWIEHLRPLRRAGQLKRTLADVEGGAHSGAEADVARLCRAYGLSQPVRQRVRTDAAGRRRWTDCEWDLPSGATLVLEVDGAFHTEVRHWGADLKRARRLTTTSRLVVRCTAFEVRHEADELAADLHRLGVPVTRREAVPVSPLQPRQL